MDIQGSTVLVSGANRGLGKSLVLDAIARGVRRVYATARNIEALDSIVEMNPERIIPMVLDIDKPDTVMAAANLAKDVNVLVNSAGILSVGHVIDADSRDVEAMMETNYLGTLRVVRAFIPIIERNGGGTIVNILTVAALGTVPAVAAYCASKMALRSATHAIRQDLAERRIKVHGVYPGPIETAMWNHILDAEAGASQFPATSPAEVAHQIFNGVEAGIEEIFPDTLSAEIRNSWTSDPQAVEQLLAHIL